MATTPVSKSSVDKTNQKVRSANYYRSLTALESANFKDYLDIKTEKDLLKLSLHKELEDFSRNGKSKFIDLISKIMQSMTTEGFTTHEIVEFISSRVEKFKSDKQKVIDFLEKSFTIVHADYTNHLKPKLLSNVEKILFNHTQETHFGAYTDIGFSLIGTNPAINRNIKTLCVSQDRNLINELAIASSTTLTTQQLNSKFLDYYKDININKNIVNPSRANPSFSSIMITNPDVKIGSRNSVELSIFFNSISNIEWSRSYPYFNAEFVIPTFSKQDSAAVIKAATINQFIHGSIKNKTSNYDLFEGSTVDKKDNKNKRTNMSIFTTPQTMVNLDEDTGHSSNSASVKKRLRLSSIKDSTQPFITLKDLSLNIAPTKGLMSYKTGKLSLILHDRSRLPDIAPFIKHDLFGAYGSEIILEYGWSHLDEEHPELNPVGSFIGNSKTKEVYSVINSSFSMDQNGQINIDLSIAMKGASVLKNTEINFIAEGRIKEQAIKSILATITSAKTSLDIAGESFVMSRFRNSDLLNPTKRIDPIAADDLNVFISECSFLRNKGIYKSFKIVEKDTALDNDGKITYYVDLSEENVVLDKRAQFFNLIFGKSVDHKKREQRIIRSSLDITTISLVINEILTSYLELYNLSSLILKQDMEESEFEAKIIETIVGGIDFIDPFYPIEKEMYDEIHEHAAYVSLGSLINSLIQTHVVNKSPNDFDEVQTIFYNANHLAAGMRYKNLSTFLIPKNELKDFIKREIKKELEEDSKKASSGITILTIESLISQIINRFIVTKDNIMYGVSDLYKKEGELVTPKDKERTQINNRIHEIYYPGEVYNSDNDVTFKVPSIKFSFDCVTANNAKSNRSILRISIYDQHDSPFESVSTILQKSYFKDFKKSVDSLVRVKNKFQGKSSFTVYKQKIQKELELLEKAGFLINNNGKYTLVTNKENSDIKKMYKSLFPSMTYGTQHTAMLSGNVSTVNENKLAAVYITRADRNKQSELNTNIKANLPLRILPVQASVETFGNPWINFGQFIFLDFDTGTTIDNMYSVTGITHNMSPGKFSTSLTLTYGDAYGQYEAAADLISSLTNSLVPRSNARLIRRKRPEKSSAETKEEVDIIINEATKINFRESIPYITDDEKSKNPALLEKEIKFVNPFYYNFLEDVTPLLIFDNSYTANAISHPNFLDKQQESTNSNNIPNTFLLSLKEVFSEDKEYALEIQTNTINTSVNKNFIYNSFQSLFERSGTNITASILINQNTNFKIVKLEDVESLLFKKQKRQNIISLNKPFTETFRNFYKNFKKIINEKNKENKKPLIEQVNQTNFQASNKTYIDCLEIIQKAYNIQDDNLLTLRVKSLTINDVVSSEFRETIKSLNGKFGAVNPEEFAKNFKKVIRKNLNNEIVRIEDDSGKQYIMLKGTGSNNKRYIKPKPGSNDGFYYVVKKEDLNIDQINSVGDNFEVNVKNIKKLLSDENNYIYRNYCIFSRFDVKMDSDVVLEVNVKDTEKNEENITAAKLKSQVAKRGFIIEFDQNVLNNIYNTTPIKNIEYIDQKQEIEITVEEIEYDNNAEFILYNDRTDSTKSNNKKINIKDMSFDITSIFTENFLNNNKASDVTDYVQKNENEKIYKINVVKIYYKIIEDSKNFLRANNKVKLLYPIKPNVGLTSFDMLVTDKKNKTIRTIIEGAKAETVEKQQIIYSNEFIFSDEKYISKDLRDIISINKFFSFNVNKEKKNSAKVIGLVHKENLGNKVFASAKNSFLFATALGSFEPSISEFRFDTIPLGRNAKQGQVELYVGRIDAYRGIQYKNLPKLDAGLSNIEIMEKWIPKEESFLDYESNFAPIPEGEVGFDFNIIRQAIKFLNTEIAKAKEEINKIEFISFYEVSDENGNFKTVGHEELLQTKKKDLRLNQQPASETIPRVDGVTIDAKIEYVDTIIGKKSNMTKKISAFKNYGGERRQLLQPKLYKILYHALRLIVMSPEHKGLVDKVVITSGGDIPLYFNFARRKSTNIRHDSGFGCDVELYKKGRKLRLVNDTQRQSQLDAQVIFLYLAICRKLGASGMCADFEYTKGEMHHIDIAKQNPDLEPISPGSKSVYGSKTYDSALDKRGRKDENGNPIKFKQSDIGTKISNTKSAFIWGTDPDDRGAYRRDFSHEAVKLIDKEYGVY